jgi:hypothetical protein
LLQTIDAGTQAYTRSIAFSPDGSTFATSHFGGFGKLWSAVDGAPRGTLGQGGSGDMHAIAYTSDGARLVSASSDSLVRIWDVKGNLVRSMGPAPAARKFISISADDQFVLAAGDGGTIQLWRIADGQLVYSFSTGGARITALRFAPNGATFYAAQSESTLGNSPTLRVYRTSDHALLETYNTEVGAIGNTPAGVLAMDISRDGRLIAYGRDDATVALAHHGLVAAPTAAVASSGDITKGAVGDLRAPDGALLAARCEPPGSKHEAQLQLDFTGRLVGPDPTRLAFQLIGGPDVPGVEQELWMRDAQTGIFELVDSRSAALNNEPVRIDLGTDFKRFVDATGNVAARVKWSATSRNDLDRPLPSDWTVTLDQAVWSAGL